MKQITARKAMNLSLIQQQITNATYHKMNSKRFKDVDLKVKITFIGVYCN